MDTFSKENGIIYKYINTDRFKTTLLSVGFYTPLDIKTRAANALCCNLLSSGTELLPDSYSFNRKLASLYGACVSSRISKHADYQELRLYLTVNDSKYSLGGEDTVAEAGNLLCDMIFGHFLSKTDFPPDVVAREKRLLIEEIEGKINEKRTYAHSRCEELMCDDEPFGLSPEGTVEEVNNITDDDISDALKRLICNSFISVTVIGSSDPTEFKTHFFENLNKADRQYKPLPKAIIKGADTVCEKIDKMPVKQGKLVLGFKNGKGGRDRDTVATWVMACIFGIGPHSRLFMNVREKMSLCYYCSASLMRTKGLMFVDSGVEDKNIEIAKNAILDQLKLIKNGEFSDRDIEFSKLFLCDSLLSAESSQSSLAAFYAQRSLEADPVTPQEMCRLIETVTREDIIAAANEFNLAATYVLCPDGSLKEDEE